MGDSGTELIKCTKSHLNELPSMMLTKSTVFSTFKQYKPLRRDHRVKTVVVAVHYILMSVTILFLYWEDYNPQLYTYSHKLQRY